MVKHTVVTSLKDSLSQFVEVYRIDSLSPTVIESAMCESLNRLGNVRLYTDVVLSPDENRIAHRVSHFLDVDSFALYRDHLVINPSGIAEIESLRITTNAAVIICQEV